jgi:hypothetical protein
MYSYHRMIWPTSRPPSPQLRAEFSARPKPSCGRAQVNRELPGAQVPILGQASADRGLRNQHRQAQLRRRSTPVGPPAPWILVACRPHSRLAAACRGKRGFQLASHRMAAVKAAASRSATAAATASPSAHVGCAMAVGCWWFGGGIARSPGAAVSRTVEPVTNRPLTSADLMEPPRRR